MAADATDPEETILVAVGTAIAARRDELGLSQRALSLESGVSRPFLSGIEAGARAATIPTLVRLARALDTTAAELLRTIR